MANKIPSLLSAAAAKLPSSKQLLLADLAERLSKPCKSELKEFGTFTADFVSGFEGVLQLHHALSSAPFTKDKFEWGLVQVLRGTGLRADHGPRGLAGHDIEVDGERWSLKTQADASIKLDRLHISKFMELGKGRWVDESDLAALRDRMLNHMKGYDRIFSLRHFDRPEDRGAEHYYELVEIPKRLLAQSAQGEIRMQHDSKQSPKPGYCTVAGKFDLYFDGGTERKLQIKNLMKSHCVLHATWIIGR